MFGQWDRGGGHKPVGAGGDGGSGAGDGKGRFFCGKAGGGCGSGCDTH